MNTVLFNESIDTACVTGGLIGAVHTATKFTGWSKETSMEGLEAAMYNLDAPEQIPTGASKGFRNEAGKPVAFRTTIFR